MDRLKQHFTKEYTVGREAHGNVLISLVIRKMQMKSTWYTTTDLLDLPELKRLTILNVAEDGEELEHSAAGGNVA